jgi:hypothetical protein
LSYFSTTFWPSQTTTQACDRWRVVVPEQLPAPPQQALLGMFDHHPNLKMVSESGIG